MAAATREKQFETQIRNPNLLEKLWQEAIPPAQRLLECQVQLERRGRVWITFDGAQLATVFLAVKIEIEGAPAQAAGLGVGHSQDVTRYPLQQAAWKQYLSTGEKVAFGCPKLRLEVLWESSYWRLVVAFFRRWAQFVTIFCKREKLGYKKSPQWDRIVLQYKESKQTQEHKSDEEKKTQKEKFQEGKRNK